MTSQSRRSERPSKRVPLSQADKEKEVQLKLTPYFTDELRKDKRLKQYFATEDAIFLGAGCFGHVFSLKAKKNLSYADLIQLTADNAKEEQDKKFNRATMLRVPKPEEIALKKDDCVAIKLESALEFGAEHFPVCADKLPDFLPERYSMCKEHNTLVNIFNRFGFKETRGFTKPYAFGHLNAMPCKVAGTDAIMCKMYPFHYLIFEMCGPDAKGCMDFCSNNCTQNDQRMSTRTVFMIGDQMLARLQCLQDSQLGLCHNDLKDDQLLAGTRENGNIIYLIDFGLVTEYKNMKGEMNQMFAGNKRWAPRVAHTSDPRTPLCEIESACYVILRMLKNHFPWDGAFDKQEAMKAAAKGKPNENEIMTGLTLLLNEKQCLWYSLRRACGKPVKVRREQEKEMEKYRDFFEERNDRWGDGGSQMKELMLHLSTYGDANVMFSLAEIRNKTIDYIKIRSFMLSIFDLSMYAHNVETGGLDINKKVFVKDFFKTNRESYSSRTEQGQPMYYYFPPGEKFCYWEWHCRIIGLTEKKPEYWRKVVANKAELAAMVRARKK